jgi:hypothetical protein
VILQRSAHPRPVFYQGVHLAFIASRSKWLSRRLKR